MYPGPGTTESVGQSLGLSDQLRVLLATELVCAQHAGEVANGRLEDAGNGRVISVSCIHGVQISDYLAVSLVWDSEKSTWVVKFTA